MIETVGEAKIVSIPALRKKRQVDQFDFGAIFYIVSSKTGKATKT